MTGRISTAQARQGLANVVRRSARGERIKVTRYGKTLAVLISKRDLQALEECEKGKAPSRPSRRPRRRIK